MRNSLIGAALMLAIGAGTAWADSAVHSAEASKGKYVATIASIGIEQPWSRAMPPTAPTGAVFVTLFNQGPPDQLVAASSPMADKVELHDHIHHNGLMKMVEVEKIELPSNSTQELKPGSYHIMLIGLRQPLVAGEHFPVQLEFANAGKIDLQVLVKDIHAGTEMHH